MIFSETINQYNSQVESAVDELFQNAEMCQKNENDILAVYIHAFLDHRHAKHYVENNISEFVFGPDTVGLCKNRFYEFFEIYRHQIQSRKQFETQLKRDKTLAELQERISIDQELMIYLKFWESDLILRQLYNLKNLSLGAEYEWDFSLKKFRMKKKLIEKDIIDPLRKTCPRFSKLIDEVYSSQIRNAVAHSKYYFVNRNLRLANKDDSNEYKLYNIPFDDWEVLFQKVLLLYNHIIKNFNRINTEHAKRAEEMHYGLALKIPKRNANGAFKLQWLKYDPIFNRWLWSTQK